MTATTDQHARQPIGEFEPGDPQSGYYNDLSGVARSYGSPGEASAWFELLAKRRERAWPVSILQLGIGAWQLRREDDGWNELFRDIAEWAVIDMDGRGRFVHYQPMPHTYSIDAPWYSAMAQGQAASLLVRAAGATGREDLFAEAHRALRPLLEDDTPLVAFEPEGPVLQEYPTDEPSHVLNGWMWALWGLYDVATADPDNAHAAAERAAFDAGVAALVARLPQYETGNGWSRYDLYPHPLTHVASPFYHSLHVAQLRAMHRIAPHAQLRETADRWGEAAARRSSRYAAVARKGAFRMLRPRRRSA
jgi:hypothetical protein